MVPVSEDTATKQISSKEVVVLLDDSTPAIQKPRNKQTTDLPTPQSPPLGSETEEKEISTTQILITGDSDLPDVSHLQDPLPVMTENTPDESHRQVSLPPFLPPTTETANETAPLTATGQDLSTQQAQPVPVPETKSPRTEVKLQAALWRDKVKSRSGSLDPEGTPFTLGSGEACVCIPNSVIEKNRKAWDSFIIGQFYEEAPARGAIHAITNGMWSKQRRDIAVSKMDGNAFLFRVPCPNARRKILSQCLW